MLLKGVTLAKLQTRKLQAVILTWNVKKQWEMGWTNLIRALENGKRSVVSKKTPKQERASFKMIENFVSFLCTLFPFPFLAQKCLGLEEVGPSSQFHHSNQREQSRPHLQCSKLSGAVERTDLCIVNSDLRWGRQTELLVKASERPPNAWGGRWQ